jgi:hypothetical protein
MSVSYRSHLVERGEIEAPCGGQPLLHGDFAKYRIAVTLFMRLQPSYGPSDAVRAALAMVSSDQRLSRPSIAHEHSRLNAGAPILRISHQPNILAALNIVGLAVLQSQLRVTSLSDTATAPVVIFVSNDYDAAGDRRFRTPVVPGWASEGTIALTGAVDRRHFARPAILAPRPELELFERWRGSVEQSAKFWATAVGRHRAVNHEVAIRCRDIMERLCVIAAQTTNASSAGMAVLEAIVNDILGLDVICVSEARLIPLLAQEIHEQLAVASPNEIHSWIWRICPRCFAYCHVECVTRTHCRWRCGECREGATREHIDFTILVYDGERACPAFLPRVALQDRIDQAVYRAAGGISYAGSVPHLVESRMVSAEAGDILAPEYGWEPAGLFRNEYGHASTASSYIERAKCAFPFYFACVKEPSQLSLEIVQVTFAKAKSIIATDEEV